MFTQAGFNLRRRRIAIAFVRRHEWPMFRVCLSRLVVFESGDLAWDGGGGRLSWPEQLRLIGLFQVHGLRSVPALELDVPLPLPSSRIDGR